MKRIHIKKPDIKGFFTKVKNLKPEDIKRHYQEKKATTPENSGTDEETVNLRKRCSRFISG